MLQFAVGFLLGDCAMQFAPALPGLWPWGALLAIAAAAAGIAHRSLLCALSCGAGWTLLIAHSIVAQQLPPSLEGEELEIVGAIASIPSATESGARFILDVQEPSKGMPPQVALSWFDPRARVA